MGGGFAEAFNFESFEGFRPGMLAKIQRVALKGLPKAV